MITYTYKVKQDNGWAELADKDVPRHVRDEAEIGRHGSGVIEHAGRKYSWRNDSEVAQPKPEARPASPRKISAREWAAVRRAAKS